MAKNSPEELPLTDDLVQHFHAQVGEVTLLTKEQELSFGKKIFNLDRKLKNELQKNGSGNPERLAKLHKEYAAARNALVTPNYPLVVNIATKYCRNGVPQADLIQEGNLGLIHAAEKYDYRKGFRFSTYAYQWIRQAMTRAIANQSRTIRLPTYVDGELWQLRRSQDTLTKISGRVPSDQELAEHTKFSLPKVIKLRTRIPQTLQLDRLLENGGTSTVADVLASPDQGPQDQAIENAMRKSVRSVINLTTDLKERRILELRFGLRGDDVHTLEEIGQQFGLTRERVRQIEAEALRKLRNLSQVRRLKSYLEGED